MSGNMSQSSRVDKALFDLFIKLDFRDKGNSALKKFIGILVAYLFANSVLSLNFLTVFDRESYMILTLSSGLFLIALLVLNDYDNLILALRSYPLISSLPVEGRSVFRGKALSALVYLIPFALVSSLPQSAFLYFYNESLVDSLLFFVTSFGFALIAAGSLIIIYSFVLLKIPGKATLLISLIQVFFFVFVFLSSTITSSYSGNVKLGGPGISIADNPGVEFLPQAFLAKSVDEPYLLFLVFAAASILFLVGFSFVGSNFNALTANALSISSAKRKKKFSLNFRVMEKLSDLILPKTGVKRASFFLVQNHIQNSAFLRTKYLPFMIMPVAFMIIGFFMKGENFLILDQSVSGFTDFAIPVTGPTILITLMMSIRMLNSSTKIMDESTQDTNWIYNSLPEKDGSGFINGASSFFFITYLIPVMLLLLLLLTLKIGFFEALINTMFAGAGVYFVNSIVSIFDKTLPFTVESGKFNSASKLLEVLISMVLGVILILIQFFAFQSIIFAIVTTLLFVLLSYLINRNS